uniref:F-box domain-containing protein n=1 Tax=Corethron hystrix TaxID=216773 RepID=A0A7S1G1Q6_9STRA|mmetsp:Transcript_7158/g.15536  ORF Transcript_7158/g.15536 Transcript_7158/m.15536 type:complete len:299 (+) Transcript_7158:152-1048(+)|eukprot:CAMPEP_0113309952 /NCGR_PEP_ID=MMETSP0010_2-20120614/7787_1 /TAXON_ID=216773 ORGANISM="Corethron hystrix, Strain 308" /NCGR_SAMPLE_ID=MMETSP0010_2 /ASSEMBLY_ACC=CAM_ASM_000155 /LENGTH=298 /DNA_ID=CAMNT_0000165301 /DNA_START=64 /DNA_END=960 /DNA_ORIENTATION=+ /assembly_acc=CAM_ASM_000155
MSNITKKTVLPNIPPLYFHERETAVSSSIDKKENAFSVLPSELEALTLTSFMDWGDLAKLSTVQKSWSGLVEDSASNTSASEGEWELASSLLDGTNGLLPHSVRAVRLLKVLSKKERHAPAMSRLARCYLTGDGVKKEAEVGLRWLSEASLTGDLESAHELGCIYERGHHAVDIDVNQAAKWFLHAAEQGLPKSMAEYALCRELGCGVVQDDTEALKYYVLAAEAGHVESNFSVGEYYEAAKGVPQSDSEACLWYYRGALGGDEDAVTALRRLEDIARIVLPPRWGRVLEVRSAGNAH